jgi:hypothetical protein
MRDKVIPIVERLQEVLGESFTEHPPSLDHQRDELVAVLNALITVTGSLIANADDHPQWLLDYIVRELRKTVHTAIDITKGGPKLWHHHRWRNSQ